MASWPARTSARGLLELPVGQRGEVGVDRSQRLAGVRRRGECADLELGVLEEEANDLTSGVPACPGDCDPSHLHDYTELGDSIHPSPARTPRLIADQPPRTPLSSPFRVALSQEVASFEGVGGAQDEGQGALVLVEAGLGPRPQGRHRVDAGPHEPPRPRVELAGDQGEHEVGDL